ncbi:MAG: hypothetical protein HY360_20335 [Verrucomicrobia bacterium]|nr:hypothetical protein [Verrucomicrobiota bacterium]
MLLLTRIFLVVTILGGIGAIVGGVRVKTAKNELIASLDAKQTDFENEKKAKDQAQNLLKDKEGQLKEKEKSLSDATEEIKKNKKELDAQVSKIKEAEEKVTKVSRELTEAKGELEKFTKNLPPGMTIDQVQAKLKEFQDLINTLDQEKKVLNEQLAKLDADRRKLEDQIKNSRQGKAPPGLTGHILSLNEEWNFVVLDIGAVQGVVEGASAIVYRGGVLVGKVKITSVEPSISIGDVLSEWKRDDILEGDTVTF